MRRVFFTAVILTVLVVSAAEFENCEEEVQEGNQAVVKNPENCTVPEHVSANFTHAFMRGVNKVIINSNLDTVLSCFRNLENALENTDISDSAFLDEGDLTAFMEKVDKDTNNLTVYVNDSMATSNASQLSNSKVKVLLPERLLDSVENRTVVVSVLSAHMQLKAQNISGDQIIGVSVDEMSISDLDSPVIISVRVKDLDNKEPKCTFYNFTSTEFEDTGCSTNWTKGDEWVVCSCDHLTYFAVLMVSPKHNLSKKDEMILSYITQIGCSLSLVFLLVAILLYFIKWRTGAEQTLQLHVSLALALILLNGHFLINYLVTSIPAACIYVAVLLHYSILATFTWTAIEGFHLYLILLRVFNIYIRRYLLKLSLVGWGLPAVVVIFIFIIDKKVYLNVGSSSGNNTFNKTCYISDELVKNVTIFGFFCVIFAFNLGMLVVTAWTIFFKRPVLPGQQKHRAKDSCTLLGVTCLLGISWGLIFFSFGQITTVGFYIFCIFNSLQGFFIFIWFCISKSTSSKSQSKTNTQQSNT